MDRTMYGKVEPGYSYQPYKVTLQNNKLAPGCKLYWLIYFFFYYEFYWFSLGDAIGYVIADEHFQRLHVNSIFLFVIYINETNENFEKECISMSSLLEIFA